MAKRNVVRSVENARRQKWVQANRDHVRQYYQGRRAEAHWEWRVLRTGTADVQRERKANLTVEGLRRLRETTPKCPCCGQVLDYGAVNPRSRKPNSASLDKVIPTDGYVLSNVSVLCRECNGKKQNSTLADLERLACYIRRHETRYVPLGRLWD